MKNKTKKEFIEAINDYSYLDEIILVKQEAKKIRNSIPKKEEIFNIAGYEKVFKRDNKGDFELIIGKGTKNEEKIRGYFANNKEEETFTQADKEEDCQTGIGLAFIIIIGIIFWWYIIG